jgi:hypothetical protein
LRKIHKQYWGEWIHAGQPLPLVVSRSRYDDVTVSWEVLWEDRKWCWSPIAEFPTWEGAQHAAHFWATRASAAME